MNTFPFRIVFRLSIVSNVLVVLFVSGCGQKEPPKAHVSGTVTLDGAPMEDGVIYFKDIEKGVMDRMEVKEGHFEGMAKVGKLRVEVSRLRQGQPFKLDKTEVPNSIETVSPTYNTESDLNANVTQEGRNEFAFDVKSKEAGGG